VTSGRGLGAAWCIRWRAGGAAWREGGLGGQHWATQRRGGEGADRAVCRGATRELGVRGARQGGTATAVSCRECGPGGRSLKGLGGGVVATGRVGGGRGGQRAV